MENTFQYILFQTCNRNNYLFSYSLEHILYMHPAMSFLYLRLFENNYRTNFLDEFAYPLKIEEELYTKEEIEYYLKKLMFYIDCVLFDGNCETDQRLDSINKEDVIEAIKNTEQLAIELIQNCNLKCKYCVYGELYKTKFKYNTIEFEKVKDIIDLLASYWRENKFDHAIKINFYGGEPLLKYDLIVDITDYIKTLNIPNVDFSFGMTTNSVLLDKEMIGYFIKNNFILAISLDGDKESNSYRVYKNGKETYDDIAGKIDLIIQENENYFDENVHFISVLHDRNELEEVYSFFQNKYNKSVYIGALNKIDIIEDKLEDFNLLYKPIRNTNRFEINENIYNHEKEWSKILKVYSSFNFDKSARKNMYTGSCLPLKKKIFITADYKLMPCEKISFDINFGSLISDNNKTYIDIDSVVKTHNKYLKQITKQCRKCYYNPLCSYCIYTLNKNTEDEYYCNKYLDNRKMSVYFSEIFSFAEKEVPEYT